MKLTLIKILLLYSIGSLAQNNTIDFSWGEKHTLAKNSKLTKLDSLLNKNEFKGITSVLIVHKGNLIFEGYYNKSDINTKHNTRSATKTITGTLIGCLLKDNLINSEKEKAFNFFKNNSFKNLDDRKKEITIEDLLTMSS